MVRTDEQYVADIRRVIREFYRPGDELRLDRFYREARKCQMCGDVVDITNCYDLRNARTNQVIVCGERCIANYAQVVSQMGEAASIVFPQQFHEEAKRINRRRRNTVIVESEPQTHGEDWSTEDLVGQRDGADDPDSDDLVADGLESDSIDWESHDYE